MFNKPISMYMPNGFDQYLNGFTTEPAQSWDNFFTEKVRRFSLIPLLLKHFILFFSFQLTNHLFEEENSGFGMDLVALNIQRGRDHGLPGYNKFRNLCGLSPLKSFRQLGAVMSSESVQAFERVYKHVDDIDLFVGGVHEQPLADGLLGPTFACIVAEQARRLKVGDRFWYENGGLPHSSNQSKCWKKELEILILFFRSTSTNSPGQLGGVDMREW